jgi:hypothetical protein
MELPMKTLVLMLIIFCSGQLFAGSFSDILRAREETIQQLTDEIKGLKSSSTNKSTATECEEDDRRRPGPSSCVPKCSVRGNDGECKLYAADFCGRRASCAEKCSVRGCDGECKLYAADVCGPDMACSENCTVRRSDGECRLYGADICR